jgi:PAS domain S-box-containing protein
MASTSPKKGIARRSSNRRASTSATKADAGYRDLFNDSPIGLYRTLANGRIVEANPALAAIFGYANPAELVGRNAADLYFRPDARSRLQEALEAQGDVGAFEVEIRRENGTPSWIRMSARALRDRRGSVSHYEGAIQDITEIRQLTQAFAESEAQYRMLFDGNPVPMWVYDETNLRFLAVNRAAQECYGYSLEEFLAMTILDIRPDEERGRFLDYYAQSTERVMGDPPRGHGVWRHRRKDGAMLFVQITTAFISFGGGRAILVAATDVTERVQAELQRERLVEELRRNRERVEAVSRRLVRAQEDTQRKIARELHDQIGQMLTGLKLMLEADDVALLGRQSAEAVALVDQLMDRVHGLTLDLRPPALDRLGLLPALAGFIQRFSDSTRVHVDFAHSAIERRFPPDVETAAFRIVQEALTNVARHAAASRASVRVRASAEILSVEVEDGGAGFDPARASAEERTAGLAGMQERAAALGGTLRIDSAPEEGTRILAELPLAVPR